MFSIGLAHASVFGHVEFVVAFAVSERARFSQPLKDIAGASSSSSSLRHIHAAPSANLAFGSSTRKLRTCFRTSPRISPEV